MVPWWFNFDPPPNGLSNEFQVQDLRKSGALQNRRRKQRSPVATGSRLPPERLGFLQGRFIFTRFLSVLYKRRNPRSFCFIQGVSQRLLRSVFRAVFKCLSQSSCGGSGFAAPSLGRCHAFGVSLANARLSPQKKTDKPRPCDPPNKNYQQPALAWKAGWEQLCIAW